MKILTGELAGQTLTYHRADDLRPTADKTRKALADMLRARLPGSRVLDLYSGTGALGIEALSGGAREVYFVEIHKQRARSIEQNLERLKISTRAHVMACDASRAIDVLEKKNSPFDIIFLDPPYDRDIHSTTLERLCAPQASLVHENSLIVCEARSKEKLMAVGLWSIIKQKTYGDAGIWIYAKNTF